MCICIYKYIHVYNISLEGASRLHSQLDSLLVFEKLAARSGSKKYNAFVWHILLLDVISQGQVPTHGRYISIYMYISLSIYILKYVMSFVFCGVALFCGEGGGACCNECWPWARMPPQAILYIICIMCYIHIVMHYDVFLVCFILYCVIHVYIYIYIYYVLLNIEYSTSYYM